jgi:hypothetical protein
VTEFFDGTPAEGSNGITKLTKLKEFLKEKVAAVVPAVWRARFHPRRKLRELAPKINPAFSHAHPPKRHYAQPAHHQPRRNLLNHSLPLFLNPRLI